MSSEKHDLIIIGGGPAGYTAAIKGALQGFTVAVVERARIGGACINRGCIPTKALWGTALELERLKHLKRHGIELGGKVSFNFEVAVDRQYAIIDKMVSNIRGRMERLGVKIYRGDAKVLSKDPFKVQVLAEEGFQLELQSRFILIATGSRPSETDVLKADHENVLTTDDIVMLREMPDTLTIAGGGVVACEFASILNKFGVRIHLLEHSSQVLSAMDPEVVQLLMKRFEREGIQIHLNTKTTKVEVVEGGPKPVKMTLAVGDKTEELYTDKLLLAIGRKPNSDGMGLEELGVQTTPRGHILVDDRLETHCKGLYAAGDVVGGQMLAHKAWYDAGVAVSAMCGGEARTDYNTVPGAIFTIPEMASVGLQPDQARQKGINVAIGKYVYAENSQAMCIGETEGLVKAVIDRDTGKVIGCTMIGHDASNLISEVALAMAAGLTAKDISNTIHPHPTLSEMIWESFLDTQGLSVHKQS